MKIEVGEYIRTNLGHIGKVIKEYTFENGEVVYPEPQEWVLDNKYVLNEAEMYQMGEQIIRHSKAIIDLIEVGDYVNGNRVIAINCNFEYIDDDSDTGVAETNEGVQTTGENIINDEFIKTIVTKEQFKEMEYRVE